MIAILTTAKRGVLKLFWYKAEYIKIYIFYKKVLLSIVHDKYLQLEKYE